jgi:hypothetical protein
MEKEILPKSSEVLDSEPDLSEIKKGQNETLTTSETKTNPAISEEQPVNQDIESILNQPDLANNENTANTAENHLSPINGTGEEDKITENLVHVKIDEVSEAHNAIAAFTGEEE